MSDVGPETNGDFKVDLDRDVFLRTLIRELSGVLEEVVGLNEASGYISVVGQAVGEQLNSAYLNSLAVDSLTREQVAGVLVDLKRRVQPTLIAPCPAPP